MDSVELASCADCGNREDEWDRGMLTPLRNNEKIAKEALAKTQSPQDAYENAIRREKGIKHIRKIKTNSFGVTTTRKQDSNR